jgi:hypothetical protein
MSRTDNEVWGFLQDCGEFLEYEAKLPDSGGYGVWARLAVYESGASMSVRIDDEHGDQLYFSEALHVPDEVAKAMIAADPELQDVSYTDEHGNVWSCYNGEEGLDDFTAYLPEVNEYGPTFGITLDYLNRTASFHVLLCYAGGDQYAEIPLPFDVGFAMTRPQNNVPVTPVTSTSLEP